MPEIAIWHAANCLGHGWNSPGRHIFAVACWLENGGFGMRYIYCDKMYISNGLVVDKGVPANKITKCSIRTSKMYTGETWTL